MSTAKSLGTRYLNAFGDLLQRACVTLLTKSGLYSEFVLQRGMWETYLSVTELTSAGKCMKVKWISCLHVAASQDANARLMTADHFCSVRSHPQRPHIYSLSSKASPITTHSAGECCLCSEVTNNPRKFFRNSKVHVFSTSYNEPAQHKGKGTQ